MILLGHRPSPSKFVGNLWKEWLHGPCITFYADSECVSHLKVKKFTWSNVLSRCTKWVRLCSTVNPHQNFTTCYHYRHLVCPTQVFGLTLNLLDSSSLKPVVTVGFCEKVKNPCWLSDLVMLTTRILFGAPVLLHEKLSAGCRRNDYMDSTQLFTLIPNL